MNVFMNANCPILLQIGCKFTTKIWNTQVFYGKFQIYLRILLKMACYSHKRANVNSAGTHRCGRAEVTTNFYSSSILVGGTNPSSPFAEFSLFYQFTGYIVHLFSTEDVHLTVDHHLNRSVSCVECIHAGCSLLVINSHCYATATRSRS